MVVDSSFLCIIIFPKKFVGAEHFALWDYFSREETPWTIEEAAEIESC